MQVKKTDEAEDEEEDLTEEEIEALHRGKQQGSRAAYFANFGFEIFDTLKLPAPHIEPVLVNCMNMVFPSSK